jgi:N-acetylglucosamine kinase-like BadF-type ATPase
MALILGIDAGGTRTRALLRDASGKILGRGAAGPANPLKVGFESCQWEILRAARRAIRSAGILPAKKSSLLPGRGRHDRFDAVAVGLAGVDRPPVHRRLLTWLKKAIPARRHLLTSDAAIALAAAIGKSPGIVIISGTGSIAYAEDDRGRAYRSGGWGTLYDDAGSGYDLGRKAIVAALRAYDGRGERTVLGRKICRALGLRDITEIILKPLTPQKIAGLFPIVLEAASQGDFMARHLCDLAGYDLAELAGALIERLGWKRREFTVVCAGGVFTSSARVRQCFSHFVRAGAARGRVILLRRPAVEGALALARELASES